jgi:hypothetical protein
LGALAVAALLTIAACSSSLPNGSTGTGGSIAGGTGGSPLIVRVPIVHRAIATTCSGDLPDTGVKTSVFDGGWAGPFAPDGGALSCAVDSDCPPCANGQLDHCFYQDFRVPASQCVCDQCNTDQDCGATGVCGCNQTGWSNSPIGNICLPGNCRIDADCGPVGFCSPSPLRCGTGGYYCHTAADTCVNDSDCAPSSCAYSLAAGAWACTGACGGG